MPQSFIKPQPVSFSLFQLILIIGITQGLLTSVMMIKSKQFQPIQRRLGFVVLVFVTVNFRALCISEGWMESSFFRFMPLGYELFLPPLLYTYVCSIIQIKNNKQVNQQAHWVLPVAWLVYDLLLYTFTLFEPTVDLKNQLGNRWYYAAVNGVEDHLIVLSTWFYLVIGTLRYKRFSFESSTMASKQLQVLHLWLKQILIWMFIVGMFLLVNHALNLLQMMQASRMLRWQAFNVFLAFTSYYMGFLGYRFQSPRLFEAINSLKSYEKKKHNTDSKHLEQQLEQLLQSKAIYLDPEVNIKQVATSLGVPAESLSFMLNQQLKITFRDYINQHRIKTVQLKIKNRHLSTSSILDVALASGFNSQASFYRVFKKFVGMTPLQYSQQQKN